MLNMCENDKYISFFKLREERNNYLLLYFGDCPVKKTRIKNKLIKMLTYKWKAAFEKKKKFSSDSWARKKGSGRRLNLKPFVIDPDREMMNSQAARDKKKC